MTASKPEPARRERGPITIELDVQVPGGMPCGSCGHNMDAHKVRCRLKFRRGRTYTNIDIGPCLMRHLVPLEDGVPQLVSCGCIHYALPEGDTVDA